MQDTEKVLYGGFVGTDDELCENTQSLGEFLLKKFQAAGDNVQLVIENRL